MSKLFLICLLLVLILYIYFFSRRTTKNGLISFPLVDRSTKLLIVSPHPDDETLIASGLIQRVLEKGGQVKIVFLTNGDASREAAWYEDQKTNLLPSDFIALGEQRINEAINAGKTLGLTEKDLVFLGFPDQGLQFLLSKNIDKRDPPFFSKTTKTDHVPYLKSYRVSQSYLGTNLLNDLIEISKTFHPTIIVTTHSLDKHPDHRAAFTFAEKIKKSLSSNIPILTSIVHNNRYPESHRFLTPPKKLLDGSWESLELTNEEIAKKKQALKEYVSQNPFSLNITFKKFSAKNEIFEIE